MEDLLMPRFDVYANEGASAKTTPYVLDIQNDLFDGLDTRMVIPLRPMAQLANVKIPERLMPVFSIAGQDFVLETPKMAAVPARVLKHQVASLVAEQASIVTALDFLFNGY